MYFPPQSPNPDFEQLLKVLKGETASVKVHFAEVAFDREIVETIDQKTTNGKFLDVEAEEAQRENLLRFKNGETIVPLADERERTYYRMGYDYFPDTWPFRYFRAMIMPKVWVTRDTAALPKSAAHTDVSMKAGNREWVEEGWGVITSWEEFEQFPWHRMRLDLGKHCRNLVETIPQGIKTMVFRSVFE